MGPTLTGIATSTLQVGCSVIQVSGRLSNHTPYAIWASMVYGIWFVPHMVI